MSLPVIITPEAEAQIETIHSWWQTNRPAAPYLFVDELAHCLYLPGEAPRIGKRYYGYPIAGLRRVLLRATRYHVYYVERIDSVLVHAVWHSRRGQMPPL